MAAKGPNNLMRSRIVILTLAFVVIGFGLVAVRLLYMQVFRNDFYVQQATTLQTRDTLVTPNRGTIYDANMQVLAESASVARITVNPKAVIDESKVNRGYRRNSSSRSWRRSLPTRWSWTTTPCWGKSKEPIPSIRSSPKR